MTKKDRETLFPYSSFSEVKIQSNEPMTSNYFNHHIIKLCQNLNALDNTNTVQKANDRQWGTVKLASINDILNENGDKNAVLTNKVINEVTDSMRQSKENDYLFSGKMSISKNYEFTTGEFIVGLNENKAVKITDYPELAAYANVYYIPIGYEKKPFYTAISKKTDLSSFTEHKITSGVINFAEKSDIVGYEEFHCYYSNSTGYVICRNGKYNDEQRQIKVVWQLFSRKH